VDAIGPNRILPVGANFGQEIQVNAFLTSAGTKQDEMPLMFRLSDQVDCSGSEDIGQVLAWLDREPRFSPREESEEPSPDTSQ
jgi:hypothetical protein